MFEKAIISLKPRHVDNILDGSKKIELRTRRMNLARGSRIWLYSTLPVAKVVGFVRLREIIEMRPPDLWHAWGAVSGITADEYWQYFSARVAAFGLILEEPRRLYREVSLAELRTVDVGFVPPQFFLRLNNRPALISLLEAANQ